MLILLIGLVGTKGLKWVQGKRREELDNKSSDNIFEKFWCQKWLRDWTMTSGIKSGIKR